METEARGDWGGARERGRKALFDVTECLPVCQLKKMSREKDGDMAA